MSTVKHGFICIAVCRRARRRAAVCQYDYDRFICDKTPHAYTTVCRRHVVRLPATSELEIRVYALNVVRPKFTLNAKPERSLIYDTTYFLKRTFGVLNMATAASVRMSRT